MFISAIYGLDPQDKGGTNILKLTFEEPLTNFQGTPTPERFQGLTIKQEIYERNIKMSQELAFMEVYSTVPLTPEELDLVLERIEPLIDATLHGSQIKGRKLTAFSPELHTAHFSTIVRRGIKALVILNINDRLRMPNSQIDVYEVMKNHITDILSK